MAYYDLVVDGSAAFYQRRASALRLVRREPLIGLTDGANTIFLTPHKPFLYETLAVYTAQAPFTPAPLYSADADGGVIRLGTPPTGGLVADYTAVPLTAPQVAHLALGGFDFMQSLWDRNFYLSSSNVTYVQAQANDPHMYIVDWDGTTLSDPAVGSLSFAASSRQRGLLARCIDIAFLDAALTDAAMMDVAIRERLGGIAIDPMRRTENILKARAALLGDLETALAAAMVEAGMDLDGVAGVPPVHTEEYERIWHWQEGHVPVGRRWTGF